MTEEGPVYYIGTYDVDDPAEFAKYPPIVASLLPRYGGVVLASDMNAYAVEGTARRMNAIIAFPSRAAALALYDDPDYQEAKRIRRRSTSNCTMVLARAFAACGWEAAALTRHHAPGLIAKRRWNLSEFVTSFCKSPYS